MSTFKPHQLTLQVFQEMAISSFLILDHHINKANKQFFSKFSSGYHSTVLCTHSATKILVYSYNIGLSASPWEIPFKFKKQIKYLNTKYWFHLWCGEKCFLRSLGYRNFQSWLWHFFFCKSCQKYQVSSSWYIVLKRTSLCWVSDERSEDLMSVFYVSVRYSSAGHSL